MKEIEEEEEEMLEQKEREEKEKETSVRENGFGWMKHRESRDKT